MSTFNFLFKLFNLLSVFCRVLLTWHRLLHLTYSLRLLRKWSLRNHPQQRNVQYIQHYCKTTVIIYPNLTKIHFQYLWIVTGFFQINHFLAVGNRAQKSSPESDIELSQSLLKKKKKKNLRQVNTNCIFRIICN